MQRIKWIGLIGLMLCCSVSIQAQNLGEWFNQKQTQTKYLIKQIVALQVYIQYLEKGYRITRDGLNLIGDLKNGELNLHRNYFHSLKTINPNIMGYPKIAAILSMQMDLLDQYHSVLKEIKTSGQFSEPEISYIKKIYDNLMNEAEKDLDELVLVTSNGQLQMTDDERIKQIDNVYKQVQDKYSFSKTFSGQINQLLEQRKQGTMEAQELRSLYGIPPNKTK